jgi:prepilin-type N-terminal cleavage/methylation domain-containing protein/prepilin-type processing-associated H-X9-DG protein
VRNRRAFTLIEMLIVVVITTLLVTMLLPAVQSARESARRTQCVNNMFQIGVALNNYESAHYAFPPGVINPTGPIVNRPGGYHYGWITQILPYLGETNAYAHFNFRHDVYSSVNDTVRSHGIRAFTCPSDPGGSGSACNLAANYHDREEPIDAGNFGVFHLNSATAIDDIHDGVSNTLFVSEHKVLQDLGWASGTSATLRNTGHLPNDPAIRPVYNTTSGFFELVQHDRDGNLRYFDQSEKEIAPANGSVDPSSTGRFTMDPETADGQVRLSTYCGGFSSYHKGGINACMGDGSVRFIKDSVSLTIFARLGHRADGQLIGYDQY